eukprot:sb/3464959/
MCDELIFALNHSLSCLFISNVPLSCYVLTLLYICLLLAMQPLSDRTPTLLAPPLPMSDLVNGLRQLQLSSTELPPLLHGLTQRGAGLLQRSAGILQRLHEIQDPGRNKRIRKISPRSPASYYRVEGGLSLRPGIVTELNEGDLQLKGEIGQGAYGNVYHALWKVGTHVAVKTLKESRGVNVAAFLRELHMLRKVGSHSGVVLCHGAVTKTSPSRLVLELCSRGDLFTVVSSCQQRLEQKCVFGALPDQTILTFHCVFEILRKIASGLMFIHSKGVVHRDIAARNILLDSFFQPKISDFGLAASCHGETTISQGVAIPVRWAAPEIVLDRTFSAASDIWSFGVLIGEVVSYGELPWSKLSEKEIKLALRQKQTPDPPHNTYYTISNHTFLPRQRLVLQCWAYDPKQRPHLRDLRDSIGNINVLRRL